MKRTLVAILALSPVLAFAQTNAPAQPRSTQIAEVVVPADLHAATPAANTATASTYRVSTGVIPPHVVKSAQFVATSGLRHVTGADQKVVLTLNVDETGKPCDLAVARSAGATLDQEVVATVSRYRFQPGMLDGQPTIVPVRLEVFIPAGTNY